MDTGRRGIGCEIKNGQSPPQIHFQDIAGDFCVYLIGGEVVIGNQFRIRGEAEQGEDSVSRVGALTGSRILDQRQKTMPSRMVPSAGILQPRRYDFWWKKHPKKNHQKKNKNKDLLVAAVEAQR